MMLPGRGTGLVFRAIAIGDYYVCLVAFCMESQHNTNCLREGFCILSPFLQQKGQKAPMAALWYHSTLCCHFVVDTLKDLGIITQLQPPFEVNIIEVFSY